MSRCFFANTRRIHVTHNASRRAPTLTVAGKKPRAASTARKTKKGADRDIARAAPLSCFDPQDRSIALTCL